ncbi:MAG: hypothetical protein RLP44_17580 [Aggregatilineales bacterium]
MSNTLFKSTFVFVFCVIASFTLIPSHSVNAVTVFDSAAVSFSGSNCGTMANRITLPAGNDYVLNSIIVFTGGTVTIHADSSGTIGTLIDTLGVGAGAAGPTTLTPSTTVILNNGQSYWVQSAGECSRISDSPATGIFSHTDTFLSIGGAPVNGYSMLIDASIVPSSSPSPFSPSIIPTDSRLNAGLADATQVVLYPAFDSAGNRTIHVYCVNSESRGYLGLVISEGDLPASAPIENTLLLESDLCDIEFWALANGSQFRFQLNVGPNIDGTVTEFLFNDIGAGGLQMRSFNLYQLGD